VHSEISSIVVYNDTLITQYENSLTRSILNNFGFPAYQIDIKIPIIALGIMSFFFVAGYRLSKTKPDLPKGSITGTRKGSDSTSSFQKNRDAGSETFQVTLWGRSFCDPRARTLKKPLDSYSASEEKYREVAKLLDCLYSRPNS